MNIPCPCKNCVDRKLGCHSICEDYKDFKEELELKKELYKAQKEKYPKIVEGDFLGDDGQMRRSKLRSRKRTMGKSASYKR